MSARDSRLFIGLAIGGLSFLLAVTAGCGTSAAKVEPRGARQAFPAQQGSSGITQIEVQQDVQRFANEFNDRVVQGLEPLLKSQNPMIREQALRRALLYSTSAIEIATGPNTEANLLDMLWFVRLSRIVLERYWLPHVYGQEGEPLLAAFKKSEANLWAIAGKVLSEDNQRKLIALVDQWHRENPDQVRVEFIRFSAFSRLAGREATRTSTEAHGLLSSLKSAVTTADSALLFGERTLYLVQKEPFLLRLHAQIGMRDITSDLAAQVESQMEKMNRAIDGIGRLRPLINDVTFLSESALRTAHESRQLAQTIAFDILPPKDKRRPGSLLLMIEGLRDSLASAERVMDRAGLLVTEAKTRGPASLAEPVTTVFNDLDRLMRRGFFYLVALGAVWALFGWGGYYLVKRSSGRQHE